MIKLYRRDPSEQLEYWESWDKGDGTYITHSGIVGDRGTTEEIRSTFFSSAERKVDKEIARRKSEGFCEIEPDDELTLLVEYPIEKFGTDADLDKRYRLEERLNELLGWTGLGRCDGGSTGTGTMEVCSYVVDFNIAKTIIETDLAGTEFANYSRIYDGDA